MVCEGQYDFDYGPLPSIGNCLEIKKRNLCKLLFFRFAFRDIQELDFLAKPCWKFYESCKKMKNELLGKMIRYVCCLVLMLIF